jgi:pimeloyl-ACP methyl ester carboxylesterase
MAQPSPPAETADCQASNAQTVVVLRTALDVARCIFSFYNTGYPIAIAKRLDVTVPTCVVLLSGTEPLNFAQATTLPEDITSALNQPERDLYALALLDAIFTLRNSGVCRQARLVLAGHSLGGMEAQNAAAFLLARQPGLSIGEIVTFGSPATADLSKAPPPRRFTTIGDPIPYTTVFTGSYRGAEQTAISDLTGARRVAAIAKAEFERYRAIGFSGVMGWGVVDLAAALPWLAFGAVGPHMQYPSTKELASYDALGNASASGTGAVLRLQTLRRFQAKR